ncbi:MAG: B12-binding domain-containing radical SAM protein, partial [Bacteroidota bacterium]
RYDAPPVPPLGLEYLYGMLTDTRHKPVLLDLCFEGNPSETLKDTISEVQPDIIGVTIRQIDSALYYTNVFFLDEIKTYIGVCKSFNIPVVLGGSGFSVMPREILEYTGADYGICGPGAFAFKQLINTLEYKGKANQLTNGFAAFSEKSYKNKRGDIVDYQTYIQKEGTIGFRTQIGCPESCFFCVEGNTPVLFHEPISVGHELYTRKHYGYTKFHLCDSEFNLNLEHCINICKAILSIAGPIDWALYMKPEPISSELFTYLYRTGASLITLSIDTHKDVRNGFHQLETFLKYADNSGIPVIIDLSVGYPYEDITRTQELLDFLDTQPVASVGINSYYRVYPNTPLFQTIKENGDLHPYLINWTPESNHLYPVFFAWFRYEELLPMLPDRKKFRIEGFEKATNYQRIKNQ